MNLDQPTNPVTTTTHRQTLTTIALLSTTFLTTAALAGPVQWTPTQGGNGNWYELIQNTPNLCWLEAQDHAEALGGELASLETLAEFEFAKTVVYGGSGPYAAMIGLQQDEDGEEPAGGWRWLSGEPLQYDQWASTLDDAGGCQDWASFADGSGYGKLDDIYPCEGCIHQSYEPRMLVEWSADCNGDGIVDYGQILDGTYEDLDGNGVPDCCDADTPCDGSVTGPIQWAENGHVYELVLADYLIAWPDARDESATRGGHLVTLTSAAENDFVFNQLAANPDASIGAWGPWIGADADGVQWNWSQTGEVWDFEAWAPGEPGSADDTKAAGYWMATEGVAQWADHHEFLELAAYVMEWSADCNGDGLVDYAQILDGELDDDNGNGVPDSCDCPSDVDGDGQIDVNDILIVLAVWSSTNPLGDVNSDGIVNVLDVLQVLADWGMDCP